MIQLIEINGIRYWKFKCKGFNLYCFSFSELIKQLKDIHNIELFENNYNLN